MVKTMTDDKNIFHICLPVEEIVPTVSFPTHMGAFYLGIEVGKFSAHHSINLDILCNWDMNDDPFNIWAMVIKCNSDSDAMLFKLNFQEHMNTYEVRKEKALHNKKIWEDAKKILEERAIQDEYKNRPIWKKIRDYFSKVQKS